MSHFLIIRALRNKTDFVGNEDGTPYRHTNEVAAASNAERLRAKFSHWDVDSPTRTSFHIVERDDDFTPTNIWRETP